MKYTVSIVFKYIGGTFTTTVETDSEMQAGPAVIAMLLTKVPEIAELGPEVGSVTQV